MLTREHRRAPCAFCPSRHKGVCDGVGVDDTAAVSALEAARSAVRVYGAGDIIYAQGDPSTHLLNVISGWIELHCDMADGRRQITTFLQPGALFGAEPDGEDHSHTATAITTVVVCPIGTKKFHDLRRAVPSLNEQFVSLLQRERQNLIRRLASVGLLTARERVGVLLWDLALTAVGGGPLRVESLIPMPLTQRHIAEATGLTSIHVNRTLRQLREERVLELRDGRLRILNPSRLRSFIEPDVPRPIWEAESARLLSG